MKISKILALVSIFFALTLGNKSYAQSFTTATNLQNYTSDDVGNLTFTGRDAYDTPSGGQITFKGSTSGSTILKPTAAAGSGTLTLPTTTGTLATVGGNIGAATLAGGNITGPAPTACGATCTISTANAGTGLILLNQAAGSSVTLPAATGTGNVYKMRISVATTSAAEKILLTTVTDTIIGTAVGENAGTAKVFVGNASTYHSIQMPFTGSVPSGGFIGDTIVCTDMASTIWACDIQYQAGTTPTTPYSASTS